MPPNKNLMDLSEFALKSGASRAKIIDTRQIAIDERVQLKCRYPPCVNYGRNLMCPPFTPPAREFEAIVAKYKCALLVQVDAKIPEPVLPKISKDGAKLVDIVKEDGESGLNNYLNDDWKRFHSLISNIERESFKRGYYLSLGLVMGSCRLCEECDTMKACEHPYEARPSMEAMGIDVFKTAKNSGLGFEWNTKKCIIYNGLVLIG
jgi:predicted metal-binding protein